MIYKESKTLYKEACKKAYNALFLKDEIKNRIVFTNDKLNTYKRYTSEELDSQSKARLAEFTKIETYVKENYINIINILDDSKAKIEYKKYLQYATDQKHIDTESISFEVVAADKKGNAVLLLIEPEFLIDKIRIEEQLYLKSRATEAFKGNKDKQVMMYTEISEYIVTMNNLIGRKKYTSKQRQAFIESKEPEERVFFEAAQLIANKYIKGLSEEAKRKQKIQDIAAQDSGLIAASIAASNKSHSLAKYGYSASVSLSDSLNRDLMLYDGTAFKFSNNTDQTQAYKQVQASFTYTEIIAMATIKELYRKAIENGERMFSLRNFEITFLGLKSTNAKIKGKTNSDCMKIIEKIYKTEIITKENVFKNDSEVGEPFTTIRHMFKLSPHISAKNKGEAYYIFSMEEQPFYITLYGNKGDTKSIDTTLLKYGKKTTTDNIAIKYFILNAIANLDNSGDTETVIKIADIQSKVNKNMKVQTINSNVKELLLDLCQRQKIMFKDTEAYRYTARSSHKLEGYRIKKREEKVRK